MTVDKSLINVFLLGLAVFLVFTPFHAMSNIQKSVIDSLKKEDANFRGSSNVMFVVFYSSLVLLIWTAPSLISLIGPRLTILVGGIAHIFYVMTFFLPKLQFFYFASVITGCGAAVIWAGLGNYLTLNSSAATISRNSGIFWAMYQLCILSEHTIVFFVFKEKTTIDTSSKNIIVGILSGIGVVGLAVMGLLPKPQKPEDAQDTEPEEITKDMFDAFKDVIKLIFTKKILFLMLTFFYTGLEYGFFSGTFSNCIDFTTQFDNPQEIAVLSGILIGVSEVLGGALLGLLEAKSLKLGRISIVITGFILHTVAFMATSMNFSNRSPMGHVTEHTIFQSNRELTLVCSFLLGFGDACYNTQIFSMLGGVFSDNSAAAFTIFKWTQSVAAFICFTYSTEIYLFIQLGIVLSFAVFGTIAFVWVEWQVREAALAENTQRRLEFGFI